MTNETHQLYVLTQTPLHIGGEQEKHWTKGFDYFEEAIDNDPTVIWKVNERKVIDKIGLDHYVSALETGPAAFKETLRQRGLSRYSDYCDKVGKIEGSGMQLHRMIAEGKTGFPYLPGTSLKGGIRSALFKAFGGSVTQKNDKGIFGQFDNSIMRFVQVGDVYFNHPGKLYNSRVYNGHLERRSNSWEGRWKYQSGSGNNEDEFQNDGFATTLQTVPPAQVGELRLGLRSSDLEQYQKAATAEQQKNNRGIKRGNSRAIKRVPGQAAELLTAPSPLEYFFTTIYNYTADYIKHEIDFFTELKGDMSDRILRELNRLQAINSVASPLLRLGYGSGFHAVTGDFQYKNHLEPLKKQEHRKLRKSRRLAFDWDEAKKEFRFYPLGFVQLLTVEAAAPHIKRQREAIQSQSKSAPKPAPKEPDNPATTPVAPKSSTISKPVQKTTKQLRKGVKVIGEVVGQQGTQIIVKPFLLGYENTTVKLRYPAGMSEGTIVEIIVRLEGKVLMGQGAPVKK